MQDVNIVIVNGPVGVGKSTVAGEISSILKSKSIAHALIDMDYLRQVFPRPKNDPYYANLGCKNLGSIWKNIKQTGARIIVMPNVIEKQSDKVQIQRAIPGANIIVVNLGAPLETIVKRLEHRESQKTLAWHVDRAKELVQKLAEADVADFTVDTKSKPISQIAGEIIDTTGLLS